MKKVKFVFAIHNHQPVGNFEHISEDAFRRAYLPLVETLRDYPWFRFNLHFTGPLLEWIVAERPDFAGMLKEMAETGQVEFLTGGFYEPILTLLPDTDKTGQIRKLTSFISAHFGQTPTGMWLAERVWEPHLPKALADAGVDHVVVDDFHFKMAGLRDSDLTGYFLTDELYSNIKVFPGSERLRYTLPFQPPKETIDYFRQLPDAGENTLAVMADDGEKFGVWPGTNKWCYEDGWFRAFVKALNENRDWVDTATFGSYVKSEPPRGRVYLPTCSYMEMGEWSLPTRAMVEYEEFLAELKGQPGFEAKRLFVKGGMFRNFLSKYPESGAMHKRMLHVSGKVHKAVGKSGLKAASAGGGTPAMLDELWKAQCNDAYWHGVFGGLYLPHLRDAVYRSLVKAELAAEKALLAKDGGDGWLNVEEADLDGDLSKEVMVSNEKVAVLADPACGGSIYELDYRDISMNLMNTLSRRPESYHGKLANAAVDSGGGAKTIHERVTVKEDGLSGLIQYDWYRRTSLIDHFLGSETDLASFRKCSYHETGDFVTGGYGCTVKKTKDRATVVMTRRGAVAGLPVSVSKTITVDRTGSGFGVGYVVENMAGEELNTTFGVEFNLSLLAGDASDRYFEIPGHVLKSKKFASEGELNVVTSVRMVDEWMGYFAELRLDSQASLWRFPVETVSQSEAGFERVYQCTSVMPLWRLSLKPGGAWAAGMEFVLGRWGGRVV